MARTNFYSSEYLDRVSHLRKDSTWLNEQLSSTSTRLLPVWQQNNLVKGTDFVEAAILEISHVESLRSDEVEPVLLACGHKLCAAHARPELDATSDASTRRLSEARARQRGSGRFLQCQSRKR